MNSSWVFPHIPKAYSPRDDDDYDPNIDYEEKGTRGVEGWIPCDNYLEGEVF